MEKDFDETEQTVKNEHENKNFKVSHTFYFRKMTSAIQEYLSLSQICQY